jgi:predicted nucleotidyltransferase
MMLRRGPDPARMRSRLGRLLAAHAEVDFAYLFGPLATRLAYYDAEVAVFLRPAPAPEAVSDYEMDLSAELTRALDVDVDVHVLNNTPQGFRYAVLQGRPLLVRDEERLIDFVEGMGPEATELGYLDEFDLRDVQP